MTKCVICLAKTKLDALYCVRCQRSFDRQVWDKTTFTEWVARRTRRFAGARAKEENFALRAALAVQRNDEDWRAKYLLAQMEAGKLRKALGEIHEELIEADCVSDCPPEWARCWVCQLRVKVGRELKEKKP